MRALAKIKQENGYNTNPKSSIGFKGLDDVPAGELPYLAVAFGDISLRQEEEGGLSLGIFRFSWQTFVWGHVWTSGHRRELYKAGNALLSDLLGAIYDDEPLTDNAGQGTVLFVDPGEILFDMESFSDDNRGYFRAEFGLVVDLLRGGSP